MPLSTHIRGLDNIPFRIVFWDVLPCKIIVDNYFTRQYIPEDNSELYTRCCENLKSHIDSIPIDRKCLSCPICFTSELLWNLVRYKPYRLSFIAWRQTVRSVQLGPTVLRNTAHGSVRIDMNQTLWWLALCSNWEHTFKCRGCPLFCDLILIRAQEQTSARKDQRKCWTTSKCGRSARHSTATKTSCKNLTWHSTPTSVDAGNAWGRLLNFVNTQFSQPPVHSYSFNQSWGLPSRHYTSPRYLRQDLQPADKLNCS
jgi:hypothetical protein